MPKDVIYDILARADPRARARERVPSSSRADQPSGAEVVWRHLARRAGRGDTAPWRYLVLDGEKREAKERDSLLSSYMRGGAASAGGATGEGRGALCGRGNHLSYTENLVVNLPVRVSERDFVFETTLALGGRRFVLRAYSAEPHVEEEDAGTLHPSYGAALCVELEMTAEDDAESGDERSSTRGRNERSSSTAPMSAHLLFQVLRREDRDEDVGASRSAVGASRSAPSLDPLTGVARLVTFQRFDVDDDGGAEILRLSRCVRAPRCTRKTDASCSATATAMRRIGFASPRCSTRTRKPPTRCPGGGAGKPRGPAGVAGARRGLELALTSPEMSRRRALRCIYSGTRWRGLR